jgi:p-methyltransferase
VDVIVISGDSSQDFLGQELRDRMRLSVDGQQATLSFLKEYFRNGRDVAKARAALEEDSLPFVSLNGPYLVQYLEARGFTVGHIPLFTPGRSDLAEMLEEGPAAVVISTTFLPIAAQIDGIAAFVKKHAPVTKIIAGGIQIWKSYQHKLLLERGLIADDISDAVSEHNYLMDLRRPSPVDVLVISESGEQTLAELLSRITERRPYDKLENTALFSEGTWRINRIVPEEYSDMDMDWSRHIPAPTAAYIPVQAGLGCGFRCTFCDFCGLRPVKARTPGSIIEEIRTIPALDGVRRVYFTDDNLFPTKKRAIEVCRAIINSGMRISWRGLVRVSIIDGETASLMAESGGIEVFLGVESGDRGQLLRMRKQTDPDDVLAGVAHLSRHGVCTKSSFILGFPGETEESVQHTVDLLNAYPVHGPAAHRYMFFLYGVLPLSEAASPASRAAHGLRGYGWEWSHTTMDAKSAAALMGRVHERIKPELSPNYVLESPELPGLDIKDIKRIYVLRNQLVLAQQRGRPSEHLWNGLAKIFEPR